jgi:hypothetical protein
MDIDITKSLEAIDEFNKHAMATISNLFDGVGITDSVLAESRIITCIVCPHYISSSSKCSLCGCFMKLKTKLIGARCPDSRW